MINSIRKAAASQTAIKKAMNNGQASAAMPLEQASTLLQKLKFGVHTRFDATIMINVKIP